MQKIDSSRWLKMAFLGCSFLAVASSTGCQSLIGGQVLPSPYYHTDDVQYFAPGPEFKLSREAAAMKAYNAEQKLQRR